MSDLKIECPMCGFDITFIGGTSAVRPAFPAVDRFAERVGKIAAEALAAVAANHPHIAFNVEDVTAIRTVFINSVNRAIEEDSHHA